MKELFIANTNVRRFRVSGAVALAAAVFILLIVAGCAPAATAAVDKTKPWMQVSFDIEKTTRYAPSFAVWAVDDATGQATALAVTKKEASGALKNRPEALPVWSAANAAGADTASSATPTGKATLTVQLPDSLKGKNFTVWIEANASYDYNDYYKEGLKSGDAGYNGVNGQPSVLWKASIDGGTNPAGTVQAAVAGHGDVLGAGGALDADMGHITTASSLLTNVSIQYSMGGQ